MISVFGYCRVSGLGQSSDGKDGFKRQGEAISRFCDGKFDLSAVFLETVSGRKDEDERATFSEMVAMMLNNCVRHVVVENLSRLARGYTVQEQFLVYLAGKGIGLISADTGENITQAILDDPMKKAVIQIQSVFFELERSMLVRKMRIARERIRSKGGRCEGGRRFGERPGELETIRKIVDLKAGGRPITEIVEFLNGGGFKTRDGARWHRKTVGRILKRVDSAENMVEKQKRENIPPVPISSPALLCSDQLAGVSDGEQSGV